MLDLLGSGVGVRSVALTLLSLLAVLYTLYFARSFFLPVLLALLLSLLLVPAVRWLHHRLWVPPAAGAAIVLAVLVGALGLAAAFVVEPASKWMQTIPSRIPDIRYRLEFLQRPLSKVQETSEQVQKLTGGESDGQVVQVREETMTGLMLRQTPALAANLLLMFVLIYFILASGDLFLRKVVRMVPTFEDKRRAVEIAREIQERISTYLRTITIVNVCVGIAVGLAAAAVGFGNYVFWGVFAFALNFIPYLGPLVGIVAMLLVGLLTFDSAAYALVMPAIYFAINLLEGNFITPSVIGRILTLNPVIVFLSLMFWGWIWGVAGALLAVPILATFKIVCDHLPLLRPIGEFVGGESAPDE
jgi:Predicted permease